MLRHLLCRPHSLVTAKAQARCFSQSFKSQIKTFELNTGARIPAIGLGTFQDPEQQEDSVTSALELGYRHIDCARVYCSRLFDMLRIN